MFEASIDAVAWSVIVLGSVADASLTNSVFLDIASDISGILPDNIPWRLVLIPPITGIIGYFTNWVAVRLMFHPIDLMGIRIPGLKKIATVLPRKVRQIPGMMEGKVGWQGIVPSRAAKMGSIAYDNSVEKVASQREFYEQFNPDVVADYVVNAGRDDIHKIVDEIIQQEYPELWEDAPEPVREFIHGRVDQRMPEVSDRLFEKTGEHINDLMNIKMMIVQYLENKPELLNQMFLEVGDKELKFLVRSGLIFGTLLGACTIPLFLWINQPWVLPVSGAMVGYLTNYIAIKAIFSPVEEKKIGPFKVQGLFIKRQNEAVDKYAELVSQKILTVENIAYHLLYGPKSDRTRKMVRDSIRPEVDESVGAARPLLKGTMGQREYDDIRDALSTEPIDYGYELLKDPEFNKERSEKMQELIAKEIKKLPPDEYVKMLRPAFEEDEWLLITVGAILGIFAGYLQNIVVNMV
ncbi:MAG: hypothetical protein ABEK59_10045 [Halobacteria archaeon]